MHINYFFVKDRIEAWSWPWITASKVKLPTSARYDQGEIKAESDGLPVNSCNYVMAYDCVWSKHEINKQFFIKDLFFKFWLKSYQSLYFIIPYYFEPQTYRNLGISFNNLIALQVV